jgi:UDP-N-acetylmuramoylalanine--D-glutamate ligase
MNGKETILMPRSEIVLKGVHNVENVLAALAVGLACGASSESMRETVRSFRGVEHRLEFVDHINGISFYNDSKATSVDATAKALDALRTDDAKIVLIMGGQGKNAPYDPLFEPIRAYVRQVIAIGEDAPNIQAQLKGSAEILNVLTMTEAVETAYGQAVYGLASKFEEAKAS